MKEYWRNVIRKSKVVVGVISFSLGSAAVVAIATGVSFNSGDTLTAANLNGLKAAIEALPEWGKNGADAYFTGAKVGIGTTTPAYPLDVVGTLRGSSIAIGQDVGGYLSIGRQSAGATIAAINAIDTSGGSNHPTAYSFQFNSVTRMSLTNTGLLSVNRSGLPVTLPLQVGNDASNGNGASLTIGGVWTNGSSRTSKENITPISGDEALSAVRNLKPVTYNYKADKTDLYAGFIAEDVPELVATRDRKGLSPMDIVAVVTKVTQLHDAKISSHEKQLKEIIQKLQAENRALKADLQSQQMTASRLETRLQSIERQLQTR